MFFRNLWHIVIERNTWTYSYFSECKDNWVEKVRTNMCYFSFSACNTQLQLSIQSEIIQTFCITRNYQHFCAPNLRWQSSQSYFFHLLLPRKQNFCFSDSSGSVWPYVVFESFILALAREGCPPYSMWSLALDSSQKLPGWCSPFAMTHPLHTVTGMWARLLRVAGTARLVWK